MELDEAVEVTRRWSRPAPYSAGDDFVEECRAARVLLRTVAEQQALVADLRDDVTKAHIDLYAQGWRDAKASL